MNPDCYRRRLFVFGYSGRIHQRNRLAGGRHRKCCVRTDQPGTDQFVFQADTCQSLLASDDWTLGTGWASCTVACCSRSPKTALPSTRCWAPRAIACCAATRRSRPRFVSAACRWCRREKQSPTDGGCEVRTRADEKKEPRLPITRLF